MKDVSIGMFIAVFEEIFGAGLFWGMVAVAGLILLAFVWQILREHRLESRRFLRAELWAPVGAVAAILFVQFVTNSGFSDIGGPIDVIVLILIGSAGAIGLTILTYVLLGLLPGRQKEAGR
ncbi:DUF5368 domain-containing protein [Oricola sp.]|uniref:DUF5368 domain-containing protein n=1 Tax=Oricola sp. TaxID=1979950 RepID=UPI0025FC3CBC|nr:DUF5368 domain-containing protein [Oricola sp.]MCI5074822.1 DUF5368 domain-containing protein [Oricola sp.]